jgi:hypothetical protein
MRAAAQDPRTGRFAATLASCQDNPAETGLHPLIPDAHSCAATQFRIDRYYGNVIEVSGQSAQPAWIMVHDYVDPGWQAELNGAPVAIQAAYGIFKAVEIPGGNAAWKARFEYHHPWFPALWWVAGIGFGLLLATCLSPKVRERLR